MRRTEYQAAAGGAAVDEYSPGSVGRTLAEGKLVLAGLQHHLVQAQTEDHAAAGGDASGAGRRGPSRTSGPGVCRLCSVPWMFPRPGSSHAVAP